MVMQTSIEWLVKSLSDRMYIHCPDFGHTIIDKLVEQAKEMHKQEIIDELIGFQVFLNNKGLITSHDWHWEALAKKYIKSFKKK
jgi:hypothetical protein